MKKPIKSSPFVIDPDARSLLEFDKIITHIKGFAVSSMAAERLDSVEFLTDSAQISREMTRVTELLAILQYDDPLPFNSLDDFRYDFEILKIQGNYLSVDRIALLAELLLSSRQLHAYLNKRADKYPHLWEITQHVIMLKDIESGIKDKIDVSAKEIRNDATPKLQSLRKRILHTEQSVRKKIEQLFRAYSRSGYLQDDLITLSDGRLVFPVKLENRARVKGIVHDQSSSGATVFIEPMESIELNNEIGALRAEERLEIERILRELTDLIRAELDSIAGNFSIMVEIDLIQSKARFAQRLDCHQPNLSQKGVLNLINGRHPLLLLHKNDRDSVIPLSLELGKAFNTLVITGPNAGGKTVALKTVGIFILMVHCGIPIPADPDSVIPVLGSIFVDIGDSQSIENDLSTFSSHMSRVRTALAHADNQSLILIDEIGVGTDPEEGAALAVSLLEELTQRGCRTIVTTHLGALKAFAYNATGVENGSMEFDAETLQPVYRFRSGVPGSSYAIEISKRLGIPAKILDRSRQLVGAEKGRLENLILELERRLQESEKAGQSLEIERSRLEGLSNLYKERYESLQKNEKSLRKKALVESQQIFARANATIERTIKEIRDSSADTKTVTRLRKEVQTQKAQVEKELLDVEDVDSGDPVRGLQSAMIAVGEAAFWRKQNLTGKIVAVQGGGKKVLLQANNLKVWVAARELFAVDKEKKTKKGVHARVKIQTEEKSDVLPEIDLRGESLDDAVARVDKFLDDALLAGWTQVRIIHGKGTGVLRKGITEFLSNLQRVKSSRVGAWNEGDLGVTIAQLD